MSTTWSDALRRVATALGRRRRIAEGEDPELSDESGFTLIELMVVLVIMGILMAIAIPTFLGVTSTANDTSTQSNLANVITSAKAVYAKSDSYPLTATMVTDLNKDEPEFKFTTAASTTQSKISVKTTSVAAVSGTVTTATGFVAAAFMTKTTECWIAANTSKNGSVKYGYLKGTGTVAAKATCKATKVTFGTTFGLPGTATVKWGSGNSWPTAPGGH